MKKVSQSLTFLLLLLSSLSGCSEKPTPEKSPNPNSASPMPEGTPEDKPAPEEAKPAAASVEPASVDDPNMEREILLAYFNYLSEGKLEEAKLLEMRTQKDCQALMLQDRCEAMLKGQNELHDQLQLDPVPRNSKLIDFAAGQKQKVGPDKGFKEGTTLWLGSTIRARGPGGNEFLMRSLGLLVRGDTKKIIWGKRRTFGDTPRNLKSPAQ